MSSQRDQRPLISTRSTREAVAAWIGRSADRAGPTPTALERDRRRSRRRAGPDDQVGDVNGRRFSTLSVVLPSVRRAGLTVTKAPAIARSISLRQGRAVEHATDELSRNETLPSGKPGVGARSTS